LFDGLAPPQQLTQEPVKQSEEVPQRMRKQKAGRRCPSIAGIFLG
jgi:hypothetical protein